MTDDIDPPGVGASGRFVMPGQAAARLGSADEDDLIWEAAPAGVLVTVDRLRKIYVEATGQCNLRCTMCPRQTWAAATGHMTATCFERLLSGLPAAEPDELTLAFGGFGEPTLHPQFLDMVEQARGAKRRVEIITNGTTMTTDLACALASLGVAQVTVSLDGGDDDAFAAMRGTSPGPIVDGLIVLREQARRGPGRMAIGVASVVTRQTAASLPALIATAQRLKLDFVSISNVVPHSREMADEAVFTYAGQVSNTNPATWRPRVTVGRFDLNEVTRPLLEALLRQLPIVPPPALDRGEWHNRCRFAREGMMAVGWDGRATPCLSLLYTHTEHLGGRDKTVRAFEVGHVDHTPIGKIWRTPTFRAFRARVREFDMSPCLGCGGCDISGSNEDDCFRTPAPSCSECLWAQGLVLCP